MRPDPVSLTHVAYWGCDSRTIEQLIKVTSRMGLSCVKFHTDSPSDNAVDVLLIDVANFFSLHSECPSWLNDHAIVGILAHGTPTEISRAAKLGATSVLHKPINQNGFFAAVSMAQTLKSKELILVRELEQLRQRQAKRSEVIKACSLVMHRYHVDVDQALSMLRQLSMQHNCSLEILCEKLLPELSKLNVITG